ncbi:MAG: RICIN domain-containing protein [Oscillospiraceae bacterium]|nr:RICIN domain-containing protein [Oscillospiraceae bacterium]
MKNWKILHPPQAFARSISKVTACFLAFALVVGSFALFSGEAVALGSNANNNETVYIRNVKSGRYLDLPNGTVTGSPDLQIWASAQNANQRWKIQRSGEFYVFRWANNTEYVLSVANTNNNTTLKLVKVTTTSFSNIPDTAKFRSIDLRPEGVFMLMTKASWDAANGKVMGTASDATSNGTKISQKALNSTIEGLTSQFWVFESTTRQAGSGYLTMSHVDSGGKSDIDYASTKYKNFVEAAMSAWNAKIGRTVLQKDSFWAIQDIHVSDGNTNTLAPGAGASLNYLGILKFYKNVMDAYPAEGVARQKTVAHEFGHILGLGDNNDGLDEEGKHKSRGNIMSQGFYAYNLSFAIDDLVTLQWLDDNRW